MFILMPRSKPPKVLSDIARPGMNVFKPRHKRVNLSHGAEFNLRLGLIGKITTVCAAIIFLILGSVSAPTLSTMASGNGSTSGEERKALEAQLDQLEKEINQYEGQISSYKKQGSTLKNEISALDSKVAKLNLQIKSINLTLSRLNLKISEIQSDIVVTQNTLNSKKEALGAAIANIYREENIGLLEIFLKDPQISDFFSNVNNLGLLQDGLRASIAQINTLKDQLEEEHTQYSLARADTGTLKEYQMSQKETVNKTKTEKNNLLAATKGQESKYQELLKKTKETAAKIRSRIFQLLGGGELSFEKAYEYAKFASQTTGVRAAMILAVLDRESALGQNVGRCNYKESMSPKNQNIFLEIVKSLNVGPDSVMVSCANADGVYGGAMGPAQFIPSTWQLYDDLVSKTTGNDPANPWNNADAFVAAALYLKDAGAAKNEQTAAAKYYCGSRWNRYVCTNVYGKKVVEQANRFQDDIDTLIAAQ